MRFSVFAAAATPFATPEGLTALAVEAEERGFATLWVPEHVVLFDEYRHEYPYAADGTLPAPSDSGLLEPFTVLAHLAAVTSTIRLGTAICLAPQRNPVYLAKETASVDWLSGGRLDFGIGVGWMREEFAAVNVNWGRRGARTDEYLAVIRALWQDDVSSFAGDFYTLPECRMYPKPIQSPHPPILIGGESEAAMRRAARSGDGWFTFGRTPADTGPAIARLEEILADHERPRDEVDVIVSPYLAGIDPGMVEAYAEAGVDEVVAVAFGGDLDSVGAALDPLMASRERAAAL